MSYLEELLQTELKPYGASFLFLPIKLLRTVKEDYQTLIERGYIDQEWRERYIEALSFEPPEEIEALSILIIAFPQPTYIVEFIDNGKTIKALLPPPYYKKEIESQLAHLFLSIQKEHEMHFTPAPLPLKALAVQGGMAEYGRNNLAYIKGMGSLFRLEGFISNYPYKSEALGPTKLMDYCKSCYRCLNACPTKAIEKGSFLIKEKKCITYHNESAESLSPIVEKASHALIGCIRCQEVCPLNWRYQEREEVISSFSGGETEMIRQGIPLPEGVINRLKRISLSPYLGILSRNLQLLLGPSQ